MESEHKLSDYNFEFPKELIASRTAGKGKTRILHCPKDGGERRIMKAPEIVELFRPGDCLVVNNTKVIPARLYGHTLHGGEVETLLVQALIPAENGEARYEAQVRPGKAFKIGRELEIAGVKTVVEDIKENWVTLSLNSKFHALLATESIPEAIAYYRLLRKGMPTLKVTALFDPNIDNTGGQTFKEEGLIEVLEGYKEQFGKTYTMSTHAAFKQDVALRLAHKKPYNGKDFTKDKQINLLIVVNQMLTGFDSKWINTLYVDKVMEYENIIQAFSRTNRLFGPDKPFGVIRYYRYPNTMKRNIDKAVAMYSDNKPLKLFADPLTHNLQQMNSIYTEIEYLFVHAGIKNFEKLPQMESERGRFVKLFNLFNKHLEAARIQGFLWEKSHYHLKQPHGGFADIDMLIDEETYKVLLKRYQELLKPSNGGGGIEEPPYDIETYLTEIETGQIDADYINERFEIYLKLINKGNASEEERSSWRMRPCQASS